MTKILIRVLLLAVFLSSGVLTATEGTKTNGPHNGPSATRHPPVLQLAQAPEADDAKKKAEEEDEDEAIWVKYAEDTKNDPPEQTMMDVVNKMVIDKKNPPFAIDVGAGGGRDTMALLKHGFKVLAVDMTNAAMKELKKRADKAYPGKLETMVEWMEDMKLKEASADLVNASYTLPFVPKNVLKEEVWPKIVKALKPGGKFTGQFFGLEHAWADDEGKNSFSKDELAKWIASSGMVVEKLEVRTWDEEGGGKKVHWEVFNVTAHKKDADEK